MATRKPPWKRARPKQAKRTLTPAQKQRAKASARKAGRRYPNLVDNMRVASGKRRAKTKDPKGGLTAAGRAAFRRSEGAHLKPGVKKRQRDMTPDELRRKGSWAVRFYGRSTLPPLRDEHGKPTRFALTAAAWGEPVPRTPAAARRIAQKGERLLAAYHKARATKSAGRKASGARSPRRKAPRQTARKTTRSRT
jgi:hypothetical protein